MCKICESWPRGIGEQYNIRTRKGIPVLPNHHPNCPHYNDSLIQVYRVHDGSKGGYYSESESEAKQFMEDDERSGVENLVMITEKMHREVFENLPEFDGF